MDPNNSSKVDGTDGTAKTPSSPRATIVMPEASSSSHHNASNADSTTLKSSKSGWDGKLRITDLAASNSNETTNEADEQAHDSHDEAHDTDTDEETLVEHSESTTGENRRTATVVNGEPIPGGVIPNEEDLLVDYDADSTDIDAVHSRISSIRKLGLERFTALERLCLRQNQITDMSKLPESLAATLEELDLYDNLIKHIKGLDEFVKLTSLDLSFNKIKHIKNVKHLTNLTDLFFVQNRITKIEELEGLVKVRNLELGGNQLRVS
jgi:Leucine-rich repeat (LRR) protein